MPATAPSIVNTSFPKDFNFIENPIVVNVTNNTDVEGSSMHQVVVQVIDSATAQLYYSFELEVMPGDTASMDVSSALRALVRPDTNPEVWADNTSFAYPKKEFVVRAFAKYMLDGKLYETDGTYWPTNGNFGTGYGAHAFLGGLSQIDRYGLSNPPKDFYKQLVFSRKPEGGEQWGRGDIRLETVYDTTDMTIKSTAYSIADAEVSMPDEHRHFLFVNAMGVFETVSAVMRESLAYKIESSIYSLVQNISYKGGESLASYKMPPVPSFRMSSGYTTREWADWWTTEFLTAKYHWMMMTLKQAVYKEEDADEYSLQDKAIWMPCVITPADEEVTVYNRAEQKLPHVDFDVQIALAGTTVNPIRLKPL